MPEADDTQQGNKQADEKIYGLSGGQLRQIKDALDHKDDLFYVRGLLEPLHVADIADVIGVLSHEQRATLIDVIREDFDPEILLELAPDVKEEIIELLGPQDSAEAIVGLDTDDAMDVIEDLGEEEQQEILDALPKEQREDLEQGLAYPEDSAGRLIEKKIVSVPEYWTVGDTIDFVRQSKELPRDFYQVYLIDPKLNPVGSVLLSRIMCSKRPVKMRDIMEGDLKLIRTDMDQEEVAFIFRQYGLVSAPVVNEEGRMIGVITVDDVVDVIEEEAQEDIMHMGGISSTDLHSGYVQTVKRRFPWLVVNLITAVIAASVIGMFEGAIQKLATLAVLMPIGASMGGNAGTQTVTVAVRGLAMKELTLANAFRVVSKEIMVGMTNGFLFAIIIGIVAFILYHNITLSLIFAMALVVTLLMAGLAGALIPLGLARIGVDPAIASGVFLTTVTDVVAYSSFLGFSTLILLR